MTTKYNFINGVYRKVELGATRSPQDIGLKDQRFNPVIVEDD
jgi:hypothetical protein